MFGNRSGIQGKITRKGRAMAKAIPRLCLKLPFRLSKIQGVSTMIGHIAEGSCIGSIGLVLAGKKRDVTGWLKYQE